MIERSVNQMARLGNKGEEATAAGFAALPFAAAVEFDRALAYADGGLALAQEIQNPLAEAAAYQYRGTLHDQQGDYARAIADYERKRVTCFASTSSSSGGRGLIREPATRAGHAHSPRKVCRGPSGPGRGGGGAQHLSGGHRPQ